MPRMGSARKQKSPSNDGLWGAREDQAAWAGIFELLLVMRFLAST